MKNEINMVGFTGSTLTSLEGKAPDPINPKTVIVNGTIETPWRYLAMNKGMIPIFAGCFLATITVNREMGRIDLKINPKMPDCDSFRGALDHHPDFTKWGINSGVQITPHQLAENIKMWRSCFVNKDVAMMLVKDLRNFVAKVNKEMEAFKDDRANYALKKSQVVDTNLPETFTLVVPIFKGQSKETIHVEININAETLNCTLISPEVNDYIAEFKDKIIDEQIKAIGEVAPALVIIEV